MTVAAPPSSRRYDLDWIRVGAFGLLILYHVGLAYGVYDWHIHSDHTFGWMKEGVLVTNPWRLTLLFLVSGSALRFMALRRTPREVMRSRIERLGPPLLFAVIFLVSIQSWIEAMDKDGWSAGYLAWLGHEFGPAGLLDGVPLNHLWFVVYIAAYSLVIVGLLARPGWIAWAEVRLSAWLAGPRLLIVPILYLILIRVTLFSQFGITNQLWWDWYNHALSLGAFLFGFLMVRQEAVWRDFERYRWVSTGIALIALPLMMLQVAHPGGAAFWGIPRNVVVAIDQWAVIAAVLGFGSRHLRAASSPVLTYLNDAVFTCYLAHQTLLVAAVWVVRPARLPSFVEAPLLVLMTLGGSLLVYEVVRRVPLLRPIWGLRPLPGRAVWPAVTRWFEGYGPRYRRRRVLLAIGVFGPVMALAAVTLAAAAYPGFDNATQYLSELGGATASLPMIFNGGVFAAGILAGVAGLGFGLAISALTGARITGVLTAVAFILAGFGLSMSTLYPWPDPRHMIINLGLGIQIAPILLLWGLRKRTDLPRLKLFLGIVFVAMALLTVLTKHMIFPGTVNDANVGWWERAYAIVLVTWVTVAAFALERSVRAHAALELAGDSALSRGNVQDTPM